MSKSTKEILGRYSKEVLIAWVFEELYFRITPQTLRALEFKRLEIEIAKRLKEMEDLSLKMKAATGQKFLDLSHEWGRSQTALERLFVEQKRLIDRLAQ